MSDHRSPYDIKTVRLEDPPLSLAADFTELVEGDFVYGFEVKDAVAKEFVASFRRANQELESLIQTLTIITWTLVISTLVTSAIVVLGRLV